MLEQFSTSLNILTAAATLAYIIRLLGALQAEKAISGFATNHSWIVSPSALKRSLLNQTIARRLTSTPRARAR